MRNLIRLLVTVHLLLPSAQAAETWFLLARHGECAPVRSLERRIADLGSIDSPEAFVRFVRAKGLQVTTRPMPVPAGAAVEVLVPDRDLFLVFATAELCAAAGTSQP